jgi:hypothetical protein
MHIATFRTSYDAQNVALSLSATVIGEQVYTTAGLKALRAAAFNQGAAVIKVVKDRSEGWY